MSQGRTSPVDEDGDFQRYYAQHLEPLQQRFESLRRKAVKERNLRLVVALAAWLAALGGVGYLAHPIGQFWPFVGFFALAAAVGLGVWAWLPAGAHNLRLREQVLPRIVPFFGDLRYRSESDLAPGRYGDWEVLPHFSEFYSEDQIEGSYRGVPLKLAEVTLRYDDSPRGGSGRSTSIAFKGLLIIFELGQKYPGVTLIRSQGSDMNGQFRLGEALHEVGGGSGFEVFATGDAPADTLADAGFLERLAEVSAQFQARQLFASFHAARLVMLIDHEGDYFEMSHRQKTDFARDAQRVRDQLGRLLAIVDLLQLRGISAEGGEEAGPFASPAFPELPDPNSADPYDIGGWGCLLAFVAFAATMSVYLGLLDSELSKGEQLWWSALGGSLLALGLFQAGRGVLRRSVGAVIAGLIFLAGALAILYSFVPPDIQTRIQSWVPGL